MSMRGSVLADVRFVINASPRMISLQQQAMGNGPFADTVIRGRNPCSTSIPSGSSVRRHMINARDIRYRTLLLHTPAS